MAPNGIMFGDKSVRNVYLQSKLYKYYSFRLFWHQTEFRLVLINQTEKCIQFNRIQRFISVCVYVTQDQPCVQNQDQPCCNFMYDFEFINLISWCNFTNVNKFSHIQKIIFLFHVKFDLTRIYLLHPFSL